MSRFCSIVLLVLVAVPSARADLDPETTRPYQVRVILSTGHHPVFTPLYKERLRRSLADCLQAALGKLGRVEAVDREILQRQQEAKGQRSPEQRAALDRALTLLGEVEKRGLQEALDTWKEVSETKTHFVLVDFADGQYVVRARQFDGLTGLPSPVVREARTGDHEFVHRLASYLLHLDFGVVGTLEPSFTLPEVSLILKAGGLGQPLGPWVQKGEVFAVSQIQKAGNGLRATRVAETLVQALEEPQGDRCRCRVLHRFDNPLPLGGRTLGYRCLKLGTTTARLRLRLVDAHDNPLAAQQVVISQDRYEPDARSSRGATDAEGFAPASREPLAHVALVEVLNAEGTKSLARFPVEILDDRPVVRSLELNPDIKKTGRFEFERKYLIKHLDECQLSVSGLVEDLDRISKGKKWDEALEKARAGLKRLQADLNTYREEMVKVRQALGPGSVNRVRERFEALRQKEGLLRDFIGRVEKAVADEKDPRRQQLRQLAEVAQLKESEADFDEAIKLYREVLQEGGNQPTFRPYAEHLAKLEKDWSLRGDEHRKARAFIYQTWPNLKSPAELKAQVGEAKKALQTCIAAGDRLTPLKLIKSNTAHATELAKRLEADLASTDPEARKEGQAIVELQPALDQLTTEATKFVRPGKPAGDAAGQKSP